MKILEKVREILILDTKERDDMNAIHQIHREIRDKISVLSIAVERGPVWTLPKS